MLKSYGYIRKIPRFYSLATLSSSRGISMNDTPPPPPIVQVPSRSQKLRKQLPFIDALLSTPTVEEAVNNILYNNPNTVPTPITRHTLNCLVADEPGVLSRISGILAGRGFNIESLVVARTEVPDLSRMTIVIHGPDSTIDQARKQLEDIVPVWAVLDYTHLKVIERELLLIKVSLLPIQESVEKETAVAPLLATCQLRQAITELSSLFHAKVVDVSLDAMTMELSAKPSRIEAFIKLLKPFGIIEVARSGVMAMPRSHALDELEDTNTKQDDQESTTVDATQLPPG